MRHLLPVALIVACSAPAQASESQVEALWAAMRLDDFSKVLVSEGEIYGEDLGQSLFPGEGGSGWTDAVKRIYDRDAMLEVLKRELHDRLDGEDMGGAVAFYKTPAGERSIDLELSAREALLDPDIEDASVARMRKMQEDDDPRLALVESYSDANALIENNVMSTMNGNLAFMQALTRAGQGPYVNDPGGILNGVWKQEGQIRSDTEQWVLSFYTFAYSPLTDEEVQKIIDFSKTKEGQDLNEALFGAFDRLYVGISSQLGTAAARYMAGERL